MPAGAIKKVDDYFLIGSKSYLLFYLRGTFIMLGKLYTI